MVSSSDPRKGRASTPVDTELSRLIVSQVLPLLKKVITGAKEEFADAVSYGSGIYACGYCFGARYVLLLGAELPKAVGKEQAPGDDESGAEDVAPVIKVGAIAHGIVASFALRRRTLKHLVGTSVSKQDIEGVKIPVSMVCVGKYLAFPCPASCWNHHACDLTLDVYHPSLVTKLTTSCVTNVENDQLFPDEVREAGKAHLEAKKIEHEIKVYPRVPHGKSPHSGASW